jgi:hypothetical protein
MTTRWSDPVVTPARRPARPRHRASAQIGWTVIAGWLILAILSWLTLILIGAYLWSLA